MDLILSFTGSLALNSSVFIGNSVSFYTFVVGKLKERNDEENLLDGDNNDGPGVNGLWQQREK